ncbi:MAG: tRNA pseudouridine(55) synthase TruB [Eubacteriales bacterium]
MPSGIVIVDKPQGWTSQDVVSKLRGVFREKRIGHGGTLDPMATGVLPVFVGRATRAVPYFEAAEKIYEAGLKLGISTDTQDTTGRVLEEKEPTSMESLDGVLDQFRGDIEQIPPMYSAVKIDGKKLYQLARKGREVERKPRPITVYSLERLDSNGDPILRIHCSKGTYVRTICHDIGQVLGCGGCMSSLRRVQAGAYDLTRAIPLADMVASENPLDYLIPVDTMFADLPVCNLTEKETAKCRNGNAVPRKDLEAGRYRVYDHSGDFFMVAKVEDGLLITEKSFFEVK